MMRFDLRDSVPSAAGAKPRSSGPGRPPRMLAAAFTLRRDQPLRDAGSVSQDRAARLRRSGHRGRDQRRGGGAWRRLHPARPVPAGSRGLWLVALLVAVFPANVYMALRPGAFQADTALGALPAAAAATADDLVDFACNPHRRCYVRTRRSCVKRTDRPMATAAAVDIRHREADRAQSGENLSTAPHVPPYLSPIPFRLHPRTSTTRSCAHGEVCCARTPRWPSGSTPSWRSGTVCR